MYLSVFYLDICYTFMYIYSLFNIASAPYFYSILAGKSGKDYWTTSMYNKHDSPDMLRSAEFELLLCDRDRYFDGKEKRQERES